MNHVHVVVNSNRKKNKKQEIDGCTLTVGLKGQLETSAFIRAIRYKVNKEVIVSSLEE